MESLKKISAMEMIRLPPFSLDHFQEEILQNLYLEFFFQRCRVIVTPELDYFTTGEAYDEETATLEFILENQGELINKVKQYILYNLALYSALLETNSYYLTMNQHLLICRFVSDPARADSFTLKLYTLRQEDLPDNYGDKIYLGRDFVSLKTLRRDHFGLKNIRNSMIEQFLKLKERLGVILQEEEYNEVETEYLKESEEIIGFFAESANTILDTFPTEISSQNLESSALIQANMNFRNLKHILIELEDSLKELEKALFQNNQARAARYVTKYYKDIANYINFIMFKVNGRISDAINDIHI